jgi:hypothetical protein
MREHITKLERKLAPEQSVVAHTKAEKDSQKLIEEESVKHGWGSWLKSMVGYGGGSSSQATDAEVMDETRLLDRLNELEVVQLGRETAHHEQSGLIRSHFTVVVPKVELCLVSTNMASQ